MLNYVRLPCSMSDSERIVEEPFRYEILKVSRPDGVNSPRYVVDAVPQYQSWYERYTPNSTGNHQVWKSFQHYKRWSGNNQTGANTGFFSVSMNDQIDYSSDDFHVGQGGYPYFLYASEFGAPGKLDNGLPGFYAVLPDGSFVAPPPDLDSLVQASLQTMLPKVKAELSLINSVIELKDFKGCLTATARVLQGLRRGRFPTIPRGFTLHRALRGVAGGYLQWMFNLKPLLSDIAAIHRALTLTQRRINDLVSRSGRVRVQHFARPLTEFEQSTESSVNKPLWSRSLAGWIPDWGLSGSYSLATDVTSTRIVLTDPTLFHAQIQYNYNYTQYQRENARILSLLDALGVNLNPAIIWNAIPWSFVVDWVLGVSRWLNEQKLGYMDPKINILQYLWSVKRSRRIILTSLLKARREYFSTSYYPPLSITRPVVTETAYRRQCGLPGPSSLIASGLSSTEFTLGAALVVTRRRRPNKG